MKGILVLILCSISVAAIAWNVDLGFIERALPPLSRFRISYPLPLAPSAASVAQSKANARKHGAHRLPSNPAEPAETPLTDAISDTSIAVGPPAVPPSKLILMPAPSNSIFNISADGASLYSSNSHYGRVVTVLKKGEVVEPQFRFNDQGIEWTYVTVADQRVSGFLQSGNLHETEKHSERAAQ